MCVQPLFPRPLDQHWTVGRNVTTARPSNTVRVTAMVARIGVPTTPHSQLPTATVSPSRRTRTVDPRPMESKRILALVVRPGTPCRIALPPCSALEIKQDTHERRSAERQSSGVRMLISDLARLSLWPLSALSSLYSHSVSIYDLESRDHISLSRELSVTPSCVRDADPGHLSFFSPL